MLSFGIPFALVPLVLLTRRRDIMGALVNRRVTTVARRVVAALIIALNLFLLVDTPDRSPGSLRRPWPSPTPSRQIVDSLPDDWTDLELDLRIDDESRYIDAARLPRRRATRSPTPSTTGTGGILVAHRFGHAAAAPAVHGALKLLDEAGHRRRDGRARDAHRARRGRPDVGPAGVRRASEFTRIRAQ